MRPSSDDADRGARLEKAALRCLELLENGRSDDARRELAAALARPAQELDADVSDLELDHAFDGAHPVADEVIDADRVAQQAMREVDRELARPLSTPPAFATGTMAELLERQGDAEGARRIRESLARRQGPATPPRRPDRSQVVARLERWLQNLRREG